MLKIFQRLWQVNWAEQWQYRANLIMYLLYWLVSPIIYLAVWTSIAASKGSVNGLTVNDFTTYYMTLLIVDQITSNIVIHTFAYKVQDGSLSGELVRPIHPMLTNALVNNIAFKILTIMGFVPIWTILYFLFKPEFSSVTLSGILLAIPAMIMGFLVGFLLSAAITSLAFWTTAGKRCPTKARSMLQMVAVSGRTMLEKNTSKAVSRTISSIWKKIATRRMEAARRGRRSRVKRCS